MKKVALFVRVSGKDQSFDRQVTELEAYAAAMGYGVEKVISEKVSGSKTALHQRPAIVKLLELARSNAIEKVLILEVSRLGRRTRDLLEIIERLHEHRVSLVVVNYRIETLDDKGRVNSMAQFLITLLGDIARMETETLSERTLSGMAEAARKGRYPGRPKGQRKPERQLLAEHALIVKKIKEGLSVRDIIKIARCSSATVQKIKGILKEQKIS